MALHQHPPQRSHNHNGGSNFRKKTAFVFCLLSWTSIFILYVTWTFMPWFEQQEREQQQSNSWSRSTTATTRTPLPSPSYNSNGQGDHQDSKITDFSTSHNFTTTTFSQDAQEHEEPRRYINPIRQISILGERNSGTRWTYDHLKKCFGHRLHVEKKLTRHKHWFQYENDTLYRHDTLVIAQFRNPYDWLKAMERVPHHSPNHLRTKPNADMNSQNSENDWLTFLTREWTMPRPGQDLQLLERAAQQRNGTSAATILCQEDFLFRDIVSCVPEPLPHSHYNHTIRYSEHQPFYEMQNNGSGRPYANILALRTDKILNFLSIRRYPHIADVWTVQYEYLLKRGTQHLLSRVYEWTGVRPHCSPEPPQIRPPKKTRYVATDFAKHVRLHLNWTVEAMIGYGIEWMREDPPREW